MERKLFFGLLNRFPQNEIIRKPVIGAVFIGVFSFLFLVVYKPLDAHPGRFLNFEFTMAAYSLVSAITVYSLIRVFKNSTHFLSEERWNIITEFIAINVLLTGTGIAVYFTAFILEETSERWNIATFNDSLLKAYLVSLIPFLFFTLLKFHLLFETRLIRSGDILREKDPKSKGDLLKIDTPLKKEELSFYPADFVYAVSEGNYLNVYLHRNNTIRKEVVRCSISSFEDQCSDIPTILRVHRAFVVNLKKVVEARGNSLGYRLKIDMIDEELPVSRRHAGGFSDRYKKLA